MFSRNLPSALAPIFLVAACASSTTPAAVLTDAGGPACPAGPNGPTAPASALPAGPCQSSEGPCDYEATPCPEVVNGAVYGYQCTCDTGVWSCAFVNSRGLCAPLPGDGSAGDAGLPTGPFDGSLVPDGPTGPAHP